MTYQDSNRLPINRDILTRLFSKIQISTEHFYEGDPCWEWQAGMDKDGYGKSTYNFGNGKKKDYRAPRLFYDLFVEIIPNHLVTDHLCRNPPCVNPTHLEAVTVRINTLRGFGVSGINARKTMCPRGHSLTDDNLVTRTRNRECKICANNLRNIRRAKRRALGLPYQ